MAHHSFISSFKRYPPARAIIIFVVAYVILEALCHLFLPTSKLEKQFDVLRERVVSEPPPDIQIMGDSVAAGAILTSLLNNASVSIRNDAVAGSGPAFSYLLLKSEIDAGRLPEKIILAHSPHTFSGVRTPVLLGRFAHWSELPGLLAEDDISLSDFTYALLTRVSYILSYREQFKEAIKGHFYFFSHDDAPDPSEQERLAIYRDEVARGEFHPRPLGEGVWPIYQESFAVSDLNNHYFSALLDLAKEHQIEIYWVTLPVTNRVFKAREEMGFNDHFYDYIDEYVQRGELRYYQKQFITYDDALFDDLSHLNTPGAIEFTRYLKIRSTTVSGLSYLTD